MLAETDAAGHIGQPLVLRIGDGDAHHLRARIEEGQRGFRAFEVRFDADPARTAAEVEDAPGSD
ncbi:MAG: hypothetical protein R3E96_08100 [Planctomycetota bacterium]